jgi:hypothetical protein
MQMSKSATSDLSRINLLDTPDVIAPPLSLSVGFLTLIVPN